jgi:hypothetical protein
VEQSAKPAPLAVAKAYLVRVSRFMVSGGDKPGETVTLSMGIDTSGDGSRDIPWTFSSGSNVIASGTERGVGAGKRIEVSATYRLPMNEGVVRFQGTVDGQNTLKEPDGERANNVSQVVEKTPKNPLQAPTALAISGKSDSAGAVTSTPARTEYSAAVKAQTLPAPINADRSSGINALGTALPTNAGTPGPAKSISVTTTPYAGPVLTSGVRAVSGPGSAVVDTAELRQNAVTSLSLEANVFRGNSVQGTVTLEAPARVMGLNINLSSSSSAVAVPASVTVAPGSTSASFTAVATAQGEPGVATVSAVVPGPGAIAKQATIAVWGVEQVQTLSLGTCRATSTGTTGAAPSSVNQMRAPRQGDTCVVHVNLDAPNRATVRANISSSNTALTVPASISILPGHGQDGFQFVVPQNAPPGPTTFTVSTDRPGSIPRQLTMSIEAAATAIQVSRVSLGSAEPGDATTGEVVLDGPAIAGGVNVTLISSSPGVTLPSTVIVPAGTSRVAFPVRVAPTSANGTVLISATRSGSGNQVVRGALNVHHLQVAGMDLVTIPGAVRLGDILYAGLPNQINVTLDGTASKDVTVNLSSSGADIQLPASITIPVGQNFRSFSVSVTTGVTGGSATVSAVRSGAGNSPRERSFSITQAQPISSSLAQSYLSFRAKPDDWYHSAAPVSTTGTVTLEAPAQLGGVRLDVAAKVGNEAGDFYGLTTSGSVFVPAGQLTGSYTVTLGTQRPTSQSLNDRAARPTQARIWIKRSDLTWQSARPVSSEMWINWN